MPDHFFIIADGGWLLEHGKHPRRLSEQGLCPLGRSAGQLAPGCKMLVKFRDSAGVVAMDDSGRLEQLGDEWFVKSPALCSSILSAKPSTLLIVFFFQGTPDDSRCVVTTCGRERLSAITNEERLAIFGLPPAESAVVQSDEIASELYASLTEQDSSLFAAQADRFLEYPNIMTALFTHLASVRSDDNLHFPIQVKKIAEQLRTRLEGRTGEPRIESLTKSHLDLWAEVGGKRFAFLDGGAARIRSISALSPTALRVGVYSVCPGVRELREREKWEMRPFLVADILDGARRPAGVPDRRRLQEAARYTFEPLSALLHLRNPKFRDTAALFVHGPLVNQFTQYDEGEPNFIPFISPASLSEWGIERTAVEERLRGLPSDSSGPMWNQFMAVYGYVMLEVQASSTPIAGVVERASGRGVTYAVMHMLEERGDFNASYTKKVRQILEEFDITDDFLFGCMLREGEYITPVPVQKNPAHKARERWGLVVRQFPAPKVMLMKTEETNFPFRVELNPAAVAQSAFLARFLYHTARLLPRYAFPVGLDIADKYAKIPDWLSRGVSATLSADVLRRAMETGDPRVVANVRLFLARGPRDFFFRPSSE